MLKTAAGRNYYRHESSMNEKRVNFIQANTLISSSPFKILATTLSFSTLVNIAIDRF